MPQSIFCTYLYRDPKTLSWRYVGKGLAKNRPLHHFYLKTRLGNLLRKRVAEGFNPTPLIITANSEGDALEMEALLIAMIGRADLKQGSLFNLTDGGEKGVTGRKASAIENEKRQATMQAKSKQERNKITQKIQRGRARFIRENPEARLRWNEKVAVAKSRITIYESREQLIAALGQGLCGRRSPTFRFV